jgi:glycogen debranching enzyme
VGPAFPIQQVPFSYAGSWFDISPVIGERRYAEDLHLVSHRTRMHPMLRLVPVRDGHRVPVTVEATPAQLTWRDDRGRVDCAYEGADTVRLRGEGLGLRILAASGTLTPFSGTYLYREPADGSHVFTAYETGRRYRVTVLAGAADASGTQELGTADRGLHLPSGRLWELSIEEYRTARAPYRADTTFEQVAKAAQADFDAFLDAVAPWRGPRTPAAALAAYVLWSATVRPDGFVTRPAVLMSKHWMDKVWSWDHCFNAVALAGGLPELAWHQFRLPFDHQDETGALPDSVTHSEVLHNFVKPPIHGWALRRLRERSPHPAGAAELAETYHQLARWTDFWLAHRTVPGDPLPYYQHGNDSGWDNATTFDPGPVAQTADLAAYLALQAHELARLAAELDRGADAARWSATAGELTDALLRRLWTGERFVSRAPASGRTWPSASLLDLTPVVLGERLPRAVGAALARGIEAHLTGYGLATEHPASPHYEADGYWRGPIWAPATVLIEDGLRRAGHAALADRVSDGFRALCERSGFAENFDAGTGDGLRDRAYTWTASGYLILAAAHERRRPGPSG